MKGKKRFLAFLLIGSTILGAMTACGNENTDQTEVADASESVSEISEKIEEPKPLVLACNSLKGQFHSFFAESEADKQIADLTAVHLLEKTRGGNYVLKGGSGESEEFNGTKYGYKGIANCEIEKNGDGSVTYTFVLRKNVKFSDGQPLTADDAIFSMYVYLDPSYEGTEELNTLPIVGLKEYRGNAQPLYELILAAGEKNENYNNFTKTQQKKFFSTYWPRAKSKFIASIMDHFDTKSVAKAMIDLGYAIKKEDTGALLTTTYREWSLKDGDKPSKEDFWDEIMRNTIFGEEVSVMSQSMVDSGVAPLGVYEYLPASYRKTVDVGSETVDSISGIQKIGKWKFSVTLNEVDPTALNKLSFAVSPLHYYGDVKKYRYKKNRFGFIKGDLSSVKKKGKAPMGAGPYVYEKYEDHTVSFHANPYYWRGEPKSSKLLVKEISDGDMAVAIADGEVDIACPTMTKSDLEQIRNVNDNHTENGNIFSTTFVDSDSFGYIGINAQNVCVNNEPMSDASIYLRKALATILSYYRFASVYDYYGNTAEIVNYQISNTSWAAPKKKEVGYEDPLNRKMDGSKIYTIRDTEKERESAVKEAALEYLLAAGYGIEKEKITSVPYGASDSYKVMITGYGQKDHPSYHILLKASKLLKSMGMKLKIEDVEESGEMFAACQSGTAQLWCAAWPEGDDPDSYLSALFSATGGTFYMFGATSERLDELLARAKQTIDPAGRKKLYRKCFEEINRFAVEIPVYQRQECTLYGTQRVNMDTVTKDQTASFHWRNEIHKISKYV